MSDDLEDVAYGLPSETPASPPSREGAQGKAWKVPKWAVVTLVIVIASTVVLELMSRVSARSSPARATRPVWNGRLADAVGEDELYRLKVTQAAMQREMALLGQWVTEGAGVLPEEADLTRVLSALSARQDELDGLVAHLEAGQARLRHMATVCRLELSVQSQRLSEQQQALAEHLAEEGN